MSKRVGFFSFYEGCYYHEYWYTSRGVYMHASGIVSCYMGSPIRCSGNEYHQQLCRVLSGKVRRDYVSLVAKEEFAKDGSSILDNGDITYS